MRGLNILKQAITPPANVPENKGLTALKNSLTPEKELGSDNIFEVGEERKGNRDLTNRDYITGYENPDTVLGGDGLDEVRANIQPWGAKATAGIGRVLSKAAVEVAKMPGIVAGGIAAPFADEGEGWDTFVNNSWVRTLDEIGDKFNDEVLPVYVKKAVREGNLMDNLTSVDFWATEGADGVGFIASMFVPGTLIKSLNVGSKLTELAAMSTRVSNFQKALGITPIAVDEFAITAANTIFESASEAGSAMNAFEKDLDKKLASGDIDQTKYDILMAQKGELGRDIFLTNLAILAGPNAINTKLLYGAAGKASKFALRGAEGELVREIASPTILKRLGSAGKGFGKALLREGFFEEGLQSTTENYFKKQAGKGELTDNYLDNINLSDFGEEYLDMLTTTDGQKAIALGGLLGGPLDVMHEYKSEKAGREQTNRLLSLGREVNDAYLATTIDTDIWKRTENINPETNEYEYEVVNGKRVVDPTKRNNLVKKASNSEQFGKLYDLAQQLGNTEALATLQSMAEDNLVIPFIRDNDNGIPVLSEFLAENPSISEDTKKRILNKATKLQDAQNEFIDFSGPVLNLQDKNSTKPDVEAFHNMLNNTVLVTTLKDIQNTNSYEAVTKQITDILHSKGITDNVDQSVKNDYASTDIRLSKLYKIKSDLEQEKKIIAEEKALIWNAKEQKKAFKEFIEEKRKNEERETPDKIAEADKKVSKIKKAKTTKEVADALANRSTKETIDGYGETTTYEEIEPSTLDKSTEASIKKTGDNKIKELSAEERTQVEAANQEIAVDRAETNESILEDIRNLENVTIDGVEYVFVKAFGVITMNTSNNSAAEVFTNEEAMITYFENILSKYAVAETPKQQKIDSDFEVAPIIHVDQFQGETLLSEDTKANEEKGIEQKKPTLGLVGVARDGKIFEWLPNKFKNWLTSYKNKKGTSITFSMPELTNISYDKNQTEAVKMLQSGDFNNRDFLYRYLPLQINIEPDNYTFAATLTDKVEEGTERYTARKNIVEAILNNPGKGVDKYKGITSKIDYQKGGTFTYIEPTHTRDAQGNSIVIDIVENNIAEFPEFGKNTKKVPLFFVKDDLGNIYDEEGNDAIDDFPSILKSGQKGYIYSVITAHNGIKVPIKMNVRKITLQQAVFIYEIYKALYMYNKTNSSKLTQKNAKLTDLYTVNPQLKMFVEKYFAKELGVFTRPSQVTVGDFVNVFIHDNVALDGSTKPYTVKYSGAGITFGLDTFVNFEKEEMESNSFKDAFIDFLTSQKRQNVKLDFLSGASPNINKASYKQYLINEKVVSVNIDTKNPFTGDINVFVSSDVNIEQQKENVSEDVKIVTGNSIADNIFETGLSSARKGDKGIYWTNFKGSRQDWEHDQEVTVEAISKFGVKFEGDASWKNFKDSWHNFRNLTLENNNKSIQEIEKKTLISENKNVSSPPGSKGGKFGKKNINPDKPEGFEKDGC